MNTFQTDIVLTEREFEDADVAELRQELADADEAMANQDMTDAEWEADQMWATREWNYR